MSSKDEHDSVKKNQNIVITNKVIAFWSRVLQISNICDIGKYVEIKKYRINGAILFASAIMGLIMLSFLSQNNYSYMIKLLSWFKPSLPYEMKPKDIEGLSAIISASPFVIIMIWFLLERAGRKKYYFRISMSGGQTHYISSDDEQFINKLMEITVAAMENSDTPITVVGNIDNSTFVKDSNIAINSDVRNSFN